MSLFVLLGLLGGLIVPPGATFTACRTDAAGLYHYELNPVRGLDDSTVPLGGNWGVTVNMGNVDSDPAPEIGVRVAKYTGTSYISRLVMLDDDLSELWARDIGDLGNVEVAGFTFADLNRDDRDEVLFPLSEVYFNTYPQYKGRVYALDGATGQDLLGWPYILPGWPEDPYMKPYSELVVADLDNNGTMEVLCEVSDNNSVRKSGSALYCLSATGDSLWKYWFYQDTTMRHGQWNKPAVADLDGDGTLEIICHEAKFNGQNPWNLLERRLFILNWDGSLRRQVRTEGPGSSFNPDYAPPVVADVDQDGDWEIVYVRRPGYVEVVDTTLNRLPGWPVDLTADAGYLYAGYTLCFSAPAVADMDGDGDLEIVVGSFGDRRSQFDWSGTIHALHHNGTPVTGFPYETRNGVWYSPGLADLDGQPGLEIFTAGCDSAFYVVTNSGDSLAGWPRRGFPTYWLPDEGSMGFLEGRIPMSKTAQLCDIDADSLIELLMSGADDRLYALSSAGPWNPAATPLATYHYDQWRTGWYRLSPTGVAEDRGSFDARRSTPNATVVRGVLDLPRDMTEVSGISDRVPRPALLDAAGRRVLDLKPGPNDVSRLAPGVYFVHSSFGIRHSSFSRVILAR
jgi:hypothetical protein